LNTFFSNSLTFTTKNKYDPYHTPTRNSNGLIFAKTHSSLEECERQQSEISSVNNPMNNEELETFKNLEKIDSINRKFSKESDCNSGENTKQHLFHIENKLLRKKICHKMSQLLQEKYGMEKVKSQEITLRVEVKIRNLHPDMKDGYKQKFRNLLKMMKVFKKKLFFILFCLYC